MSESSPSLTSRVRAAIKKSTRAEKFWLGGCLAVFIASIAGLLWQTNAAFLIRRPAAGGALTEGVIGAPRFINPLLATSNADRDLTALVYSGLLRYDGGGELKPDLAERFTVSDDGREYHFWLKPDLLWPDDEPLTADDVIFTVKTAKDQTLRSPRRAAWEGVEASKISEREILFTLKQPAASFIENATLGLLPAHLWRALTAETFALSNLNTVPLGSGPYQIKRINRDRDNLPTSYTLKPFTRFALGRPRLKKLTIIFYPNEDELIAAYRHGEIASVNAISPDRVKDLITDENRLLTASLPRVFAVFFNQNQAKIFAQSEVREALNLLVNRQEIIDEVLNGYGEAATDPLPTATSTSTIPDGPASAANRLQSRGWKKNPDTGLWEQTVKKETKTLSFTLSTADTAELERTAAILKRVWEEFGAKVTVKIFEPGALNQSVIRPREYEALLFGEIVGRQPDLYSFWHSSQRLDPGLNIALYTNAAVDKLLEELKTASPFLDQSEKYEAAAAAISQDTPAIFLYRPRFLYLLPKKITGAELKVVSAPTDRFLNIHEWYETTEEIWPIFYHRKND